MLSQIERVRYKCTFSSFLALEKILSSRYLTSYKSLFRFLCHLDWNELNQDLSSEFKEHQIAQLHNYYIINKYISFSNWIGLFQKYFSLKKTLPRKPSIDSVVICHRIVHAVLQNNLTYSADYVFFFFKPIFSLFETFISSIRLMLVFSFNMYDSYVDKESKYNIYDHFVLHTKFLTCYIIMHVH